MNALAPRARRLVVRLALLFALVQAAGIAAASLTLPTMQGRVAGPTLIILLLVFDVAVLVVFSRWLIQASVSLPLERLKADVNRIADGDYHHRVEKPTREELLDIRDGVNRLADRLIAEQERLAENIESLDQTNRDLTAARDQVVRSARLASVGTLAAGIAHEVGNPLGAIIGFVDVARTRAERAGEDTELLDSIRGEARRIDRIVRGLLDFARPQGTTAGPETVGAVVARVHDVLDSQGRLDAVTSEWPDPGQADAPILHPHRLEQVLVNLVLNALHAVREADEPRITVRVREEAGRLHFMPIRREDDPPGINYMHRRRRARDVQGVGSIAGADRLTVIEVSDNGYGIPEDSIDRLFDPFFTTKDPGEGTGLGLAICARLVEGMGGAIEARSEGEDGATFLIRLPVVDDSAEDISQLEAPTGATERS